MSCFLATFSRTRLACGMTSVPTPSPAITAIVNVFMDSNLIVARMRRGAPRSCELYTEGSMQRDFLCAPLARLGTPVCRIGLSATYRPGCETVHKALDEGLNYFQYFGFDRQMTTVLRETIGSHRDRY